MPTTLQSEQPSDRELQQGEELNAVIGQQVLHALGLPGGLLQIQVCRLWEDHYRVNVLTDEHRAAAKVAHSYFLVADDKGNVVASTPKLTRRY
jgi:hypothetical protein